MTVERATCSFRRTLRIRDNPWPRSVTSTPQLHPYPSPVTIPTPARSNSPSKMSSASHQLWSEVPSAIPLNTISKKTRWLISSPHWIGNCFCHNFCNDMTDYPETLLLILPDALGLD